MSVLEDDLAAGLVRLYGDVQSDLFHKICTNANYTQRVLFILKTQKGSHSARVGLGELGLKAAKENRNVDDYTSIWCTAFSRSPNLCSTVTARFPLRQKSRHQS